MRLPQKKINRTMKRMDNTEKACIEMETYYMIKGALKISENVCFQK